MSSGRSSTPPSSGSTARPAGEIIMFMDDLVEKDGFAVSRRSFVRFSLGVSAAAAFFPWRTALADDAPDYKKKDGKDPKKKDTHVEARIGQTISGGGQCKAVIML